MANTREMILEVLAQSGITNMSVEDVVAEFQASDELAIHLAGAADVEQAVLAHMPDYLVLRGIANDVMKNSESLDPTQTQGGSTNVTAMPAAVTSAQASAIAALVSSDLSVKQMKSEQSEMTAVLIDKPYPGEWMSGIGKLHVKGEVEKVIDQMKKQYSPDAASSELLKKTDSTFIPSNTQLSELKVLHQASHKESKIIPAWFDFDNEAAYKGVLEIMTGGDGTFDVLIAPKEDEGEGAYKNKAWRWNTKGFAVRMPSDEAGAATAVERIVTKQGLQGILLTELAGHIISHRENGLGCKLGFTKKKAAAGASAAAVAKTPTLRVTGNSPAANPETRVINAIGHGQGKMTVRSSAFYFAVRVNKNGNWSVKKVRVPLLWEQAPVWERCPEYVEAFPVKVPGGIGRPDAKALQEIQEAQVALAAKIMGEGAHRIAFGLTGFCMEVEERVNKNAATAAQQLSL